MKIKFRKDEVTLIFTTKHIIADTFKKDEEIELIVLHLNKDYLGKSLIVFDFWQRYAHQSESAIKIKKEINENTYSAWIYNESLFSEKEFEKCCTIQQGY